MRNTMRRYTRVILGLTLAASMAGCLDLDVMNENNPDRRRALSNPADVENIIGISAFRRWYNTLHGLAHIATPFPNTADEGPNTAVQVAVQRSQAPRIASRSDDLAAQVWIQRP